jgi:hypothetical protein
MGRFSSPNERRPGSPAVVWSRPIVARRLAASKASRRTGKRRNFKAWPGTTDMPRTSQPQKKAALDRSLKAMFQRLESRATPDRLTDLIDQLEAFDRPAFKKAG